MTDSLHRKLYYKLFKEATLGNIKINPLSVLNFMKYRLSKIIRYGINYYPISAQFFVTRRCNLNCGFCRFFNELNSSDKEEYDFTVEKVKEFLKIPIIENCLLFNLTGGEPFMIKDIFPIIRLLRERGYMVYVSSNGIAIPSQIKETRESGINLLSLSLYESNLNDIISIVLKLKDSMFIKIHSIIRFNNISEIENTVKLCVDIGAHSVFFIDHYPNTDVDNIIFDDNEEFITIKNTVNKKYGNKIAIHWSEGFPAKLKKRKCRLPFYYIGINAKGDISPCCVTFPNKKYGNILKESSREIWNNKIYTDARRSLLNNKIPIHQICNGCTPLYEDIHGI